MNKRIQYHILNVLPKYDWKNYYIVRHGAFATNGEIKTIFSFFALLLCYDNIEYFYLFLTSSFIWSCIEGVLQIMNIRKINKMFFFDHQIPLFFSLLLQGTQEAGFVCVYGLWFADRLFTHWRLFLLSNIAIFLLVLKNGYNCKIQKHASIRCITTQNSLLCLTGTGIINIYGLFYIETYRPLLMCLCMSILGSVWTFGQVIMGLRCVETDKGLASNEERFAILSFDVFIEISCAYLPFYFIVHLFLNS